MGRKKKNFKELVEAAGEPETFILAVPVETIAEVVVEVPVENTPPAPVKVEKFYLVEQECKVPTDNGQYFVLAKNKVLSDRYYNIQELLEMGVPLTPVASGKYIKKAIIF